MPIARPVDMHVRLSDRAYDTLKELEEISGFTGSRLIEEVILAADDLMQYLAEFQFSTEELTARGQLTQEAAIISFSTFFGALRTILQRLGYEVVFEELSKSRKREQAKKRESTEGPSGKNPSQER
jgi:hypothetical protein